MERADNITGVITPSLTYLLDQATIVPNPDCETHTIAFIYHELASQFYWAIKKIFPHDNKIRVVNPTPHNGILYSIRLKNDQLSHLQALKIPVQPASDNLHAIQEKVIELQNKIKQDYKDLLTESNTQERKHRYSPYASPQPEFEDALFTLFLSSVHCLTAMIALHQQLDNEYISQWNQCFNDAINLLSNYYQASYEASGIMWNRHLIAKNVLITCININLNPYPYAKKTKFLFFLPAHTNFWQYFFLTLGEIKDLKKEEFRRIVSFLEHFNELKDKLTAMPDLFWKMFFKGISKLKTFKDANHFITAISEIDMTTAAFYTDRSFLEVFSKSIASNGFVSAVHFFQYLSSLTSQGLSFIFSQPSSCQFLSEASKLLKDSSSLLLLILINKILHSSFNGDIKALHKSLSFWAYWIHSIHQWEKCFSIKYIDDYKPVMDNKDYSEKAYLNKLTQAINKQIKLENKHYRENNIISRIISSSTIFTSRSFQDICKSLFEMTDDPTRYLSTTLFTDDEEFKIFTQYAAYIDWLAFRPSPQHPIDQVWHVLQKRFYKKFNGAMRKLALQEVIEKIVDYQPKITNERFMMNEKFQELKNIIHAYDLSPSKGYEHANLLKLWALFGYVEDYIETERIDKPLPEIYKTAYDFIRCETYYYFPSSDEKKEYRYYGYDPNTSITLNEKQHTELSLNNLNYREYRTLDYIINSSLSTEAYKKFGPGLNFHAIVNALKNWDPHFKSLLKDEDHFLITPSFSTLHNTNENFQNPPKRDAHIRSEKEAHSSFEMTSLK